MSIREKFVRRVDPRTHCDLITAVSNQIPLHLNLNEGFIKFTSNCIVKIITKIVIRNTMSCSGDTYRELLDGQGSVQSVVM